MDINTFVLQYVFPVSWATGSQPELLEDGSKSISIVADEWKYIDRWMEPTEDTFFGKEVISTDGVDIWIRNYMGANLYSGMGYEFLREALGHYIPDNYDRRGPIYYEKGDWTYRTIYVDHDMYMELIGQDGILMYQGMYSIAKM